MARKICITFLVLVIIIATAAFAVNYGGEEGACEYLRIHVRANSNSEQDQQIKYEIKDEIVAYLTPFVAGCASKDEAITAVKKQLFGIEAVASGALKKRGFFYGARAAVKRESFPTRVYGGLTLEAGEYDALIVELGSGSGDNWWCVVYPPLCFSSGGTDVKYKSLIAKWLP